MKKAQGSLEYLIMIAAVLTVATLIVMFITGGFGIHRASAIVALCRAEASACNLAHVVDPYDLCLNCTNACSDPSTGEEVFSDAITCCQLGRGEMIYEGSTGCSLICNDADIDGYNETTADCPFPFGTDCDDANINVNPGVAAEDCTSPEDDDCDGFVNCADIDCATASECINGGNGGTEICNDLDDDGDSLIDEGCDDDGDGYCDEDMGISGTPAVCPNGGGDCDDTDSSVNPGETEICNNIDDDCDDVIDGHQQDCPLTQGVCSGYKQTCTAGVWDPEPCTYGVDYEDGTELTCNDVKDNDCDGDTDCADSNCLIGCAVGYAVGDSGKIIKTTDGGQIWSFVANPVPYAGGSSYSRLYSVFFVDKTTGWVVGANGDIFKTTNGGSGLWIKQTSGVTVYLHSVFFIDANTGWIAGRSGTILKTTNGGSSWSSQKSSGSNLYGIHFLDSSKGAAVGAGGAIFTTKDGGKKWTSRICSGVTQDLNSVWCHSVGSTDYCSAVGNSGRVVRFTLGATFSCTSGTALWCWAGGKCSAITQNLRSVQIMGQYGLATGDNGRIVRNADYGNPSLWDDIYDIYWSGTRPTNNLYGVSFVGGVKLGCVAGWSKMIMRTTNIPWPPDSYPPLESWAQATVNTGTYGMDIYSIHFPVQ